METADRLPLAHQSLAVRMLIVERSRRVAPTLVATRLRRGRIIVVDVVDAVGVHWLIGTESHQARKRELTLVRTR